MTWAQDWIFQPQLLPAWLSGLAAVVALAISVWAALRVGAAERRRDRLQARGIAVAIYPELLKLPTLIQNARDDLARLKDRHGYLVGQSVAASVQQFARIGVPSMLDRNIDRLFMLGDAAGPACLQLVTVLNQYNALVDQITARMVTLNANQWAEGVSHLQEHLKLLDAIVAKCEHEVQPIHDAIKG